MTHASETVTLVNISVDGLVHVLKALDLGIEAMPPVLAITPTAFYDEDAMRVENAIAEHLTAQGILQGLGAVLPELAHWLSLVARADRRMDLRADSGGDSLRMCLVRSGSEHVLIARFDDDVTIHPVVTASQPFQQFASAAVMSALGPSEVAQFPPQTFAQDELNETAGGADRGEYGTALQTLGAPMAAAVAIQAVADQELRRTTIVLNERSAHGIYATRASVVVHDAGTAGRIVVAMSRSLGENWVTISPGTEQKICSALEDLQEFLPSRGWFAAEG